MGAIAAVAVIALGLSAYGDYASTITADDPYLYWHFDDAAGVTRAADASGNGREGTIWYAPTGGAAPGYSSGQALAIKIH